MKFRITISLTLLFTACILTEKKHHKSLDTSISKIQTDSTKMDSYGFLKISEIDARQLLSELAIGTEKNDLGIVTTIGQTKPDWLDRDDLEFLISEMESEEKSKCIVRVISSYIPDSKNMTIGNQVISIIEAYRNGQAYPNGLTICEFYEKEKIVERN